MEDFDCPVNLNPEIICRICLETPKSPLMSLFVKEIVDGELITLPTVFQQLFRIKVLRNDKLPQQICHPCKQKLIESTKFKRKCENSNKVLHELLEPGYDYNIYDVALKGEKQVKVDSSCQTHDLEATPATEEQIFEDGIQYCKLKEKLEKVYGNIGDDLMDLCNLYACFDRENENFCVIPGCYERISSVLALQRHMREKHSSILTEFSETIDLFLDNEVKEPEQVPIEAEIPEQYTITEGNELIHVAEINDENYFPEENDEEEQEMTKKDPENAQQEEPEDKILEITNVAYHCPICHKLYQGPDDIEKHRILHEIVLPTIFETIDHYCCEICKTVFTTYDQIKEHFNQGHETLDPSKRGIDREFGSLPAISTKLFLFKEMDEESKDYLEMFETHEHKDDMPFICGVCQKSYIYIESIKYHTYSHATEFKCPLEDCNANFDFAYKLLGHMRYSHYKEKIIDLTCPYCRKQFKAKKDYNVHVRDKCEKRTVVCKVCEKKFVNQAALKNHVKVHDEQKCEECGETYLTQSDLRNHLKKDHADEEKMYKCNYCPKRFRTPSHRTDHEQTHNTENKYQCDICQNFYKSERVLRSHQKLHTVGRSHACPICGKMFNRNYHVKLHLKTHREKPL